MNQYGNTDQTSNNLFPQNRQQTNSPSLIYPDSPLPLTVTPVATPEMPHHNLSNKLKVGIVGIAIIMIAISVTVTLIFTHDTISSWDVLSAENSATELSSDLSNIDSVAKSLETSSTLTDFSTISNSMSNYVNDARNQYSLLAISPVLRNNKVRDSFTAFRNEWTAYDVYVEGTASDYKTLGPLIVELNNDQQSALIASQKSSNNLGSELVQYSALINSIGQQAPSLKMQTLPDKQIVSNLEVYVKSSDQGIVQAQSDLSANKGVSFISVDITAIAAAAATFSNEQDSWATSSYTSLQQNEPSNQIAALTSAIKNLSKSVSQQ